MPIHMLRFRVTGCFLIKRIEHEKEQRTRWPLLFLLLMLYQVHMICFSIFADDKFQFKITGFINVAGLSRVWKVTDMIRASDFIAEHLHGNTADAVVTLDIGSKVSDFLNDVIFVI